MNDKIIAKFEQHIVKNNMNTDAANIAILECVRVGYVTANQLILAYRKALQAQVETINNTLFKDMR